jgi:hypothetical protein
MRVSGYWWLVAGFWFLVSGCHNLFRVARCGSRVEYQTNPKFEIQNHPHLLALWSPQGAGLKV